MPHTLHRPPPARRSPHHVRLLGFRLERDRARRVDDELEDARWFTRAELEEARAAGEAGTDLLYFPRPFAIAHHLVAWWLDR